MQHMAFLFFWICSVQTVTELNWERLVKLSMYGSFEKFSLWMYCLPQNCFNFLSSISTLGAFSPNTFTNSLLRLQ